MPVNENYLVLILVSIDSVLMKLFFQSSCIIQKLVDLSQQYHPIFVLLFQQIFLTNDFYKYLVHIEKQDNLRNTFRFSVLVSRNALCIE